MKGIEIYQQPFVDVFGQFKVTEWATSQKEGDVSEVFDKQVAKNVLKIAGSTSASNYIQVPASRNLPKQALGLTGKHLYLALNVPAGKQFVSHFDYVINDQRTVRVSLSNLYKDFKNCNNASLQIPVKLQPAQWTLVCLNISQLFEQNKIFSPAQPQSFYLRSFQICSSVFVKGVYTSDIQFTVSSLPKNIGFKLQAGRDWFQEYKWINYPEIQLNHDLAAVKETKVAKKTKSVKFQGDPEQKITVEQPEQAPVIADYEEEKKKAAQQQQDAKDQLEVAQRAFLQRTEQEVGKLQRDYDTALESKHIKTKAEVVLYQSEDFYDPNKSQRRNCEKFVLKPDPIMALDRILGVHPKHQSGNVWFNKDDKLASEMLYTQANCIVGYHNKLQKQRLIVTDLEILQFAVCKGFAVTLSSQQNGSKVQKTGAIAKELVLSVFDLETEKLVITVKPSMQTIRNLCISPDNNALCISGRDSQSRELILVYSFPDLVNQKIELLARQLSDFELLSLRFIDNTQLCGCGKENIRIFKIKNNYLPSQLITLNNVARNKVFNNSLRHEGKKILYVTTSCGQLYIVNMQTRQVDKILQLHEGPVQTILMTQKFMLTASKQGSLKMWSHEFTKLLSELSVSSVSSVDINNDNSEICILSEDGTLSVLELDTSSYKVVMRSHQDDIVEICHNKQAAALVSIGKDSSIKVWNCESLDQIHEFNTAHSDPPTKIQSSQYDDTVAVGFKSGILRVFNLCGDERQCLYETQIFESAVVDIQYSIKFMAVFYRNAKIVIFNIEGNEIKPVKNIDYEFPNNSNFSLSFSPDGAYLANISSNANIITIWETRNFGLRWYIDLTGETINKIVFAPNGCDLLVMTTQGTLKYLRINPLLGEVETVREQFGVTGQTPTDVVISPNNKFIIACGEDGLIKVYDYFMRGLTEAACQAYIGHLHFASKMCLSADMRYLYTVGQGNGIYRWAFYGDKEIPNDLSILFEKTQAEIQREEAKEQVAIQLPTFSQPELKTYTEEQIAKLRNDIINERDPSAPQGSLALPRPHQELIQDGGISLKRRPIVEYTPAGYTYEEHEITLSKILGCSIAPEVGDNIAWDQKHHCFIYTLQNKLVFEDFNVQKSQLLKQEFNDSIYAVQLSNDKRLLLAYTKFGHIDGFPQCIVWDTASRRKVSQIAVQDHELKCVHFSNYSNMILVVSYDGKQNSTISVWDFMEGRRDWLAKSIVPFEIKDARWNPYLNNTADEFVTVSQEVYHYWRITQAMQMQYQLGKTPQKFEGSITAVSFVEPMHEQNSVYMLIGLSTGYIWVLDTRSNSFLHAAKVIDCAVHKIVSSVSRIVVEGASDTKLRAWELKKTIGDFDYDASDPDYFFAGKEMTLTLDGFPSASHYDITAAEALIISTNNSIWLVNFIEQITVKLKSCHEPTTSLRAVDFKYVSPNEYQPEGQDLGYTFDQNYLVGSSGTDGTVKVWSMYDLEHMLNFTVPKEECIAIAMHQFKPFMVCSFTDSFLRFFDLDSAKNLGRCKINSNDEQPDRVTQIRILPSGMHLLCATQYGQVFLIFVESWLPLSITIQSLVSLNTPVHNFDVSFLEPYNKWLVAGQDGRTVVYNRQDCNSFKQELFDKHSPPQFIFMDSFNLQEYVDNCFTESKRVNTLDHYYSMTQRTLVHNEVVPDNYTEAVFLNNDLASYICYIRKVSCLLIRNFELHQVVKKIDLKCRLSMMQMAPGSAPYVYLVLETNEIQMIDFVNESNQTSVITMHEQVKTIKVCPNGRYLLTAGTKGDIAIWAVRRV